MRLPHLCFLALLSLGVAPAQAAKHCLPYAPLRISLSGTLERAAGPTSPAGKNAEAGPLAAYTLRLPAPVCVAVSADGQSAAHDNVHVLALVLTPAQAAHLDEDLGQTVRLHGRLSQGAHVDPVAEGAVRLTVEEIEGD